MDNHVDPDNDPLSLAAMAQIDEMCRVFEEGYRAGAPDSLESLLNDAPQALRSSLLRELLLLELEYRCRAGDEPLASEYATRFPDYDETVAAVFAHLRAEADQTETTDSSHPPHWETPPPTGISPGDSLERYTVLQELGHGGFGTVYLARDEVLRREVAVKIPRGDRFKSNEEKESFLDEARTAANLKHENIVPIHHAGRSETGVPFVVMEYLQGDSLDAMIRQGQLTYSQIAELVAELADVVHYAHKEGVVHRDLKPSNIIFNANGKACITDFGLAERWEPLTAEGSENRAALAGTSQYIPPEVYTGTAVTDPRIDVYALGVILYQALTGRYPYAGGTLNEVQEQIQAGAVPLPKEIDPNVPERLQRICLKAIEPAGHRYESAQMLADELRRFLEGREVLARPLRYDIELRGKLQNHYAAIHLWREQNLISMGEMDRLLRPYWFLLQSDSPWPSLARLYPLESIAIRLGGWLVLLSTLLWPLFTWDDLTSWPRIASVTFPTMALIAVGWILRYVGSQRTARIFLGTGALLLPLLVVVILEESTLPRWDRGDAWELFASFTSELSPSNVQFTVGAAVFMANCVILLRLFPGKMFAIWLAVGVYVFFTGLLAVCGLKDWLYDEPVTRAILCYFLPCVLLYVGAFVWDRFDHRGEAAMLYAFFPIIFVALLTLLAYFGSKEWLEQDLSREDAFRNEKVNLWWMCNGLAYALAAVLSQRATAGFIRYWSAFFTVLLPLSLLLPCNLLFNTGEPLFDLGDSPVTVYQLMCGLAAIGFIVLGTVISRTTLSIPGLFGLAVFVFRFTYEHFADDKLWPLYVATVGGVAMLTGVAFVLARARRAERPTVPARDLAAGRAP